MKVYQLKLAITLFITVFCLSLFAQVKSASKSVLQKQMLSFSVEEKVNADEFFTQTAQRMSLSSNDEMVLKSESPGKNNYTYKKYEQTYKGVPVFGSAYTLRVQNGYVKRAGGYYLPSIDVNIKPDISSDQALQIAMQEMKAKEYVWQNVGLANIPGYAQKPIPTLVIIDGSYPASSEYYKLAYQVDIKSTDPVDKKRYFIDAHTGRALLDLPLMMHQAVPGTGLTKYYGEQSFTVDSIGPSEFQLLDPTRGDGNAVFGGNGQIFTDSDNFWDLFNLNQNEVAVDAHYCTEKFYDLMLNTFDWDGIDNEGGSMNCIVNAGDFVNAFWDGVSASFGNGDCNHGPLTTLEVVAHEFMHGITQNTSDLIYSSESGAINESMSDIFGKALEYYEDPDRFVWTIGQSFLETEYARPFRSFTDPNEFEHPKFYNGEFWSEFGGVHTNSSIGNHWFYLLVNGGNGANEIGYTYDFQGIGMDKALQIVFLVQTTALVPNSNYNHYHESSLIAAEELFGDGSDEFIAVLQAWNVVGVDGLGAQNDDFNLTISTNTRLTTCANNENIEIEFQIVNSGTIPYTPDMNGQLEIFYNGDGYQQNTKLISLDQTILPGESISYTVDDFIFIDEEDFLFVDFLLTASTSNDFFVESLFVIISNSLHTNNDLEIFTNFSNFNVLSAVPACQSGEVELEFVVNNKSCEAIPEGTPFDLVFYDNLGEPVFTEAFQVPTDLGNNQSYSLPISINYENVASKVSTMVLEMENDPDEDNNTVFLGFKDLEVIDSEYTQTFDHFILDKVDLTGNASFAIRLPTEFQNENYFLAAGGSFFDEPTLCADLAEYFKSERVALQMCVDTKDMASPSLGFDLIQFRDQEEIEFQELVNNTNVVKVSWTDGQNDFEEFISGQSEGQLQNYVFELPADARGIAKVEFYNKSGDTDLDGILFGNDVTLLDNLTIGSELTSVKQKQIVDFDIQPNPSIGLFQLSYPDTPDAIVLTNIHGQEVLNITPNANTHDLDISDLPDGNYAITLIYPEGISTSIMVKVTP